MNRLLKIKRNCLTFLVMLIGLSCNGQAERYKPAVSCDSPKRTDVLQIEDGKVRGVFTEDGKVAVYAGLPYAAPPTGELRWREPNPVAKWDNILEADHFSAIAMQPRIPLFLQNEMAKAMGQPQKEYLELMSEDCLYLNVWAPAEKSVTPYPVLVYFHGGSLRTGSGSEDMYCGEEAARNGVVMVTVNYRLGVFGYLSLPRLSEESGHGSGNYGLLDQIAALKWVRHNISKFGGDPSKVTIAGESAGSQSVSVLCVSPLAKGLFHGAIGESATFAAPELASGTFSQQQAEENGMKFLQDCKASGVTDLRNMPAEELMKHELKDISIVEDGYALPEKVYDIYQKGMQNDVPLLVGYNANEGLFFTMFSNPTPEDYHRQLAETFKEKAGEIEALYSVSTNEEAKAALGDLTGLYSIGWPTMKWAEIQHKTGKYPVYTYYFSYGKNTELHATHGTEMQYAYFCPNAQTRWNENDHAFSRKMFTYWMNFVKYGNPNSKVVDNNNGKQDLPEWEMFEPSIMRTMELGEHIGMIKEPNVKLYDILNK